MMSNCPDCGTNDIYWSSKYAIYWCFVCNKRINEALSTTDDGSEETKG